MMEEIQIIEAEPVQQAVELAQGLVTDEDVVRLTDSLAVIADAYRNDVMFRTETQMRVSVLNDTRHPTDASKLAQAYRECAVHATELFELACEYHKKLIDLEEEEDNIEWRDGFDRRRHEVEITRLKFHLSQMSKTAHHRIREINTWRQIIQELQEKPMVDESVSMAVRFCKEIHAMEVMQAHFPPADARNLYGLLHHAIKQVREKGLEEQFMAQINGDAQLIDWCVRKGILVNTPGTEVKE